MSKIKMNEITADLFTSERTNPPTPGIVMKREPGKPYYGIWVLRTGNGELIDFGRYRNDIAEKHNLELVYPSKDGLCKTVSY